MYCSLYLPGQAETVFTQVLPDPFDPFLGFPSLDTHFLSIWHLFMSRHTQNSLHFTASEKRTLLEYSFFQTEWSFSSPSNLFNPYLFRSFFPVSFTGEPGTVIFISFYNDVILYLWTASPEKSAYQLVETPNTVSERNSNCKGDQYIWKNILQTASIIRSSRTTPACRLSSMTYIPAMLLRN